MVCGSYAWLSNDVATALAPESGKIRLFSGAAQPLSANKVAPPAPDVPFFLSHTGRVIRATTILSVRHRDRTVMAGDGQVTLGNTVLKQTAKKIRRLYNDSILAGFAGSAADSFALFSRFEAKLEQYRGNLERSAVELARD